MKATHTPGPLFPRKNSAGMWELFVEDREHSQSTAFITRQDEVGEADARLYGAAPDMLRILVDTYYRLADIHNEWPGRNSLAGQKRLCDMRDCIAKALGMEPKDVYEGEAMLMGVAQ